MERDRELFHATGRMHSNYQRAQSFAGHISTYGLVLCALIAATSFLYPGEAGAKVDVRVFNVIRGQLPNSYLNRVEEHVSTTFNLDADLTPLFNWNTKQVYVYLSATYPGPRYVDNEVVLWDHIITSEKKAVLKLRNRKNKYPVTDISGGFNQRNGTLTFHWNTQPWVGLLRFGANTDGAQQIEFPPPKKRASGH